MAKFEIGAFARSVMETAGDGPKDIEAITGEILALKEKAGTAILDIGRRLIDAKALLPHGEWLPWLNERVEFSERTARNFMRLAREWTNRQTLADLGAAKALTLLALPAEEREQFVEDHNVIDMSVNGISIGEYGQMALCARELGIPAIFAAGEEALAREAEALTPGVITAAVKRGILPDGLEHLSTEEYRTAKLSALHKSPAAACRLIREQAFQAARKFLTEPESFHYPRLEPPIEIVTRLRMTNGAPAHCEIQRNDRSFIAAMNSKPEIRT